MKGAGKGRKGREGKRKRGKGRKGEEGKGKEGRVRCSGKRKGRKGRGRERRKGGGREGKGKGVYFFAECRIFNGNGDILEFLGEHIVHVPSHNSVSQVSQRGGA